jgi:hypothetical protein
MKTKLTLKLAAIVLLFVTLGLPLSTAFAQGTAFTYQGRLFSGANPANGTYNLTFSLYNLSSGGVLQAGPVTTNGVVISNGLFTVLIDFGPGVFTGSGGANYVTNWLQIGVESNGVASFTTLTPRQGVTPAPYAIFAETGGAALTLDGLGPNNFWQTGGNTVTSGQFLGSLNSQPLVLEVDAQPVLTLALNGSLGMGTSTTLGIDSVALGFSSTTSGGDYEVAIGNTAQATGNGSVAIGWRPVSSGPGAVALGESTTAGGNDAFVAGYQSQANGQFSVAIGNVSTASGQSSWALGNRALAANNGSFVWADDSTNTSFGDTAANQFLIRSAGGVGINTTSPGGQLDVEGSTFFPNGIYVTTPTSGGNGILAVANNGFDAFGVWGQSSSGYGVVGTGTGTGTGVWGEADSSGYGVQGASSSGTGVYGSSGSGNGVQGSSTSSNGVYGAYSGTTGTAAGVEGVTASTSADANGVYGVVSSTSPGGFSAGVRGQNNGTSGGGIGVYGSQAGSGWGVFGTTPSGIGVYGSTSTGTGVEAESSSGSGLYAFSGTGDAIEAYSSSGSALTIDNGGIAVSGAGVGTSTAAFIQVATSGNISGSVTFINNPLCNGNPNAILIVTPNYSAGSGQWNHPIGVYYDTSNSEWSIVNEDLAAMTAGPAFNVLIINN